MSLNMEDAPPAYLAMAWSEYYFNPGLLTTYLGEDANNIRDMTDARPGMKRNEIHVQSMDDLHKTMTDFLTRPIVFKIQLEHQKFEHHLPSQNVLRIWKDDVAVIVNPKNQGIRDILTEYFTKAIQCMNKGSKFSLKFDFASSVGEWHSAIYNGNRKSMDSGHMEVWITNAETPMECVDNPWFILCCCPLWCVMCGPFFLLGRLSVTDMRKNVSGFPVHFVSHDLSLIQMFTPSTTDHQQTREQRSLPRLLQELEAREDATREREERIYRVLAGDLLARPLPKQPDVTTPEVDSSQTGESEENPPTYEEATKEDAIANDNQCID